MIHVHLPPEHETGGLRDLLQRAAAQALAQQGVTGLAELSVALGDDSLLMQLNRTHRGENKATDVLSFSAGVKNPENGTHYLGDIVISIERAEAQANLAGHSLEDEMQLLTVHGVLHLLGHDHSDSEEKASMWTAQAEVLQALGVEISAAAIEKAVKAH